MGWKIVDVEESHSLSLFLDNLIVLKDNDKITISLNNVDVLIINNFKLRLSIQLINALTNKNIIVIICDNNYLPSSLIIPVVGNYNTLKIFQSQLEWNHQFKSNLWNKLISSKIYNQAWFLSNILNKPDKYNELISLMNDMKEYDVSNREGHASKIYWHTIFGLDWKRHDDDYWNKLLNYGYTVLRAYFIRSIIKKGLDPRISIFHKSFHNHFALASDLMEPFRIIVDYEVYCLYQIGEIDFYNHKQILIKAFNNKILINDKLHFINNAIDIFIDAIVNQTELPTLKFNYMIENERDKLDDN